MQLRTIARFALMLAMSAVLFQGTSSAGNDSPPLDVLLVSGGGWHDYETQKKLIPAGLKKRLNVDIDVNHASGGKQAPKKHPAFKGKNWADGYDLVVYNICNSSDMNNPDWVRHITNPHRKKGVPAVMIHCSMHCFSPDESRLWQNMTGVDSSNHESQHPITMTNQKPKHPIMKGFPKQWKTPKGELYRIKDTHDIIPLATGVAGEGTSHPTVWINKFGKGRVFSTTIGHHNVTIKKDTYMDLVARGALWAAGKLTKDGNPVQGYGASN